MLTSLVWVLVVTTCAQPAVDSTCDYRLATEYTYPSQRDCLAEREQMGVVGGECIPARVDSTPEGYQ